VDGRAIKLDARVEARAAQACVYLSVVVSFEDREQ
jgi:hypothetical protein